VTPISLAVVSISPPGFRCLCARVSCACVRVCACVYVCVFCTVDMCCCFSVHVSVCSVCSICAVALLFRKIFPAFASCHRSDLRCALSIPSLPPRSLRVMG
jgi:hypothetical protein